MQTFPFSFDPQWRPVLRLMGVRPGSAQVEVDADFFRLRFGPWSLRTPLVNVAEVRITGHYHPLRAIGVRVSLADRGLTLGTSSRRGACVRFRVPVDVLTPMDLLRHPAVTVTVADPEGLAEALTPYTRPASV